MQPRHIFAEDYPPSRSWDLLAWCQARGADTFSVSFDGLEGSQPLITDALWQALQPSQLGQLERAGLVHYKGDHGPRQRRQVWALTTGTVSLLQASLPDGLFTEPTYAEGGWLEDPLFYREGELMMGVVSHEHEGVLFLTDIEVAQLAADGLPTHDAPRWL